MVHGRKKGGFLYRLKLGSINKDWASGRTGGGISGLVPWHKQMLGLRFAIHTREGDRRSSFWGKRFEVWGLGPNGTKDVHATAERGLPQ